MMPTAPRLPRSLFGRLVLILLAALLVAQAATFGLLWFERSAASRSMMLSYVTRDIASAVSILDRLPAAERDAWLARLDRNNYRYLLNAAPEELPGQSPLSDAIAAGVEQHLDAGLRIDHGLASDGTPRLGLRLRDGTPLSIRLMPAAPSMSGWLPLLLAGQCLLLAAAAWVAVRAATRPLAQFADAAEALVPGRGPIRIPENGPSEVTQAARSFNAMQDRINRHLQERTRILAAISHDLQTPVTRMRLRAELLDDGDDRNRWLRDLDAMESLVREGIAYARSMQLPAMPPQKIEIDSLVAAIAADYQDSGSRLSVACASGATVTSYPNAVKRILSNLIENALKFGGQAEVSTRMEGGQLVIEVRDAGPGIPEAELGAVLQPFYRLESSRNAETGGSGLGLAIADQLAQLCGGRLKLGNREEGGLSACFIMPVPD